MTFYYPFPLFGMVVWVYGAAEICVHVTGNVWKRYGCWWLLMIVERWLEPAYDGCFNHILQRIYFYIARTDFTSVNCPDRTRAGDAFYYSDDAYCRLVTSALELWPRRSPHRCIAPSPSFVFRSPCADRRFFLRPAAEPMTFRPAAAATSAPPFFLRGSATRRQSDTDHSERHSSE